MKTKSEIFKSLFSEIKAVAPVELKPKEYYKIYHTDNPANYNIYLFQDYDKFGNYMMRLMDWRGKTFLSDPFSVDKDIMLARLNNNQIEKFIH